MLGWGQRGGRRHAGHSHGRFWPLHGELLPTAGSGQGGSQPLSPPCGPRAAALACHLLSQPRSHSPGGPRRKWLCRSAAPCGHTRLPTAPGPPRSPPRGSPEGHPCVPLSLRPPGLSYPLFPAASLSRALATRTPPPLFLGAEGRRGECQGSVASGRSGASAAVSAVSPGRRGCPRPQTPLLRCSPCSSQQREGWGGVPRGFWGTKATGVPPCPRSGRCTRLCRASAPAPASPASPSSARPQRVSPGSLGPATALSPPL